MKLKEFRRKAVELFEQFECLDDINLDCDRCQFSYDSGTGCMHSDILDALR